LNEDETELLELMEDIRQIVKERNNLARLYIRKTGRKPQSPLDPEFFKWLYENAS